jgi:hypothetical protein
VCVDKVLNDDGSTEEESRVPLTAPEEIKVFIFVAFNVASFLLGTAMSVQMWLGQMTKNPGLLSNQLLFCIMCSMAAVSILGAITAVMKKFYGLRFYAFSVMILICAQTAVVAVMALGTRASVLESDPSPQLTKETMENMKLYCKTVHRPHLRLNKQLTVHNVLWVDCDLHETAVKEGYATVNKTATGVCACQTTDCVLTFVEDQFREGLVGFACAILLQCLLASAAWNLLRPWYERIDVARRAEPTLRNNSWKEVLAFFYETSGLIEPQPESLDALKARPVSQGLSYLGILLNVLTVPIRRSLE